VVWEAHVWTACPESSHDHWITGVKLTIPRSLVVLCDTWNWSDDNDTVSGIAILDTTAIPEMRSAISVSFRIRQSQYSVYSQIVAVIKIVCMRVCTVTSALVLCDTWNWSDDNDTISGIAILDTTAIPEMRSAISMLFRIRQSQYSVYSQTVAVIKVVCMRVGNRIVLVDCCSRTHCCTVITVIFCDFTIRFSITGVQRARC